MTAPPLALIATTNKHTYKPSHTVLAGLAKYNQHNIYSYAQNDSIGRDVRLSFDIHIEIF